MNNIELRAIRKSIALTQHELSERLDVSRKTVIAWESADGEIDEGVALRVLKLAGHIRLVENSYWVEPTIRDTYAVTGRRIIGTGGRIDGRTMLFGEFNRRDHAYRWCVALQRTADARRTRKLQRRRFADSESTTAT